MKKYVYKAIFLAILLIGICLVLTGKGMVLTNHMVLGTFGINLVIILINLLKESELGYSIEEMMWIFMFFFMFIAPVIEYGRQIFPWWDTGVFNNLLLIQTNLIITLFLIVFLIAKRFIKIKNRESRMYFKNDNIVMNCAFYLSVIFSVIIIYKTGAINLLSRESNYMANTGQIAGLIFSSMGIFPITGILLHINYRRVHGEFFSLIQLIIIAVLGVLINFPTGIPRFSAAVIYIGIFVAVINIFKNRYIFRILMIFGLMYVFPLINVFRSNSFSSVISMKVDMPNFIHQFLNGNFDAYSILSRTILYNFHHGIIYGRQLLGTLLFFVPRALWASKPLGSGATIASALNWSTHNISCPYIAEGLINFGIIGVIIFAIVLAYIIKYATAKYENIIINKKNNEKIWFVSLIYPFALGFMFYAMRGDLMSAYSYFVGFIMPTIILYIIDFTVYKVKKSR